MGAKEYLSQALWLDRRINSKLEQLEILRTLAMKVSVNLTEEKVSGGKNTKSHMENTIAKIVDLENEINRDICRLVSVKAKIMDIIGRVDDPIGQIILEMRYINGKGWDEISRELNYKDSSIFKIHSRALKEIAKIRKEGSKIQ